jgi:hypothetical protein
MNKQYTTKENIENYLLNTIDPSFVDQITSWIIAMSNQIDIICNRPIFSDEEETFLYDGDNTDMIIVKDVCSISSVKVDGVETPYAKYPANKPYASRIRLIDTKFTPGIQNVSVTGIQAMNEALPDDITFACTILVAGIINTQKKLEKIGTTEKIGNYTITYRDDAQKTDFETAKTILAGYKRISL